MTFFRRTASLCRNVKIRATAGFRFVANTKFPGDLCHEVQNETLPDSTFLLISVLFSNIFFRLQALPSLAGRNQKLLKSWRKTSSLGPWISATSKTAILKQSIRKSCLRMIRSDRYNCSGVQHRSISTGDSAQHGKYHPTVRQHWCTPAPGGAHGIHTGRRQAAAGRSGLP